MALIELERPTLEPERFGAIMTSDPEIPEEREGTLNPAVIRDRDENLILLARIVGEGNYSRIAICRVQTDDLGNPCGVERTKFALEPKGESEALGVEDPRVTFIEALDSYVMAYTAVGLDGKPRIALATSHDAYDWDRAGIMEFDETSGFEGLNDAHNKDAIFFPEPVLDEDGDLCLAMMHRPIFNTQLPPAVTESAPSIWMSKVKLHNVLVDGMLNTAGLTQWSDHRIIASPEQPWEEKRIGGGTPPILTPEGWLTFYHGVSGNIEEEGGQRMYAAGILILDKAEPHKVVYRSEHPVLIPETDDEKFGIVSNVVFPTGIDSPNERTLDVYYGMADKAIGVARFIMSNLHKDPNRLEREVDDTKLVTVV